MDLKNKKLLIAGGGTGGHILAGVAVADAWKVMHGADAQILFVGAQGGIEEKLVPRSGYSLQLLKIGSLNRVSITRKLKTYFQLPLSFLKSAIILLRYRPGFVLGVGGYSSGPLVLMARVLRTVLLIRPQIAILEQNSVPGLTNRILGKLTDFVFAAFPGSEAQFPAGQVVLTGNPVRSSMKPMKSAQRHPFIVFIFGGSQGALGINSLVLDALPHLKDLLLKGEIELIHQTGERDWERVTQEYQKVGVTGRVEKFIYDMPEVYAKASLLICRAGSSTLAEVAAVGRAAVLIPLPTAADNHQEKNARVFTDANAALLFSQTQTRGEDLAKLILSLKSQPDKLSQMEKAVVRFFRPTAAEDIVKRLSHA
jgi:UDP-N-acetylglucosamine--N-acetylmuramyl-(pentapeptide) pyrophosphoryl-undecaprenol N-acetylglucosamine transferase